MRTILLACFLVGCSAPSFDMTFADLSTDDDAATDGDAPELAEEAKADSVVPDVSDAFSFDASPDRVDADADSHLEVDSAKVDSTTPADTTPAVDTAPADTSTCAECFGTCSKAGEDHTCWSMCSSEGKHCTWSPGNCGCNK